MHSSRATSASLGRRARRGPLPVRDWRSVLAPEDWRRLAGDLHLSPRELQLVQHIFEGKKMIVIAQEMNLALGTIKTYAQRLYQKVGVTDQRALTLAIFRAHLRA